MNEYTMCSRCEEKPAAICISCLTDCTLEQQPKAGEWTKQIRASLAISDAFDQTEGKPSNPLIKPLLEACARLNTSEARLKKALEPIAEWYGGGTEGNRSNIEILINVVSDLQKDRAEVLTLSKRVKELETIIDKAQKEG